MPWKEISAMEERRGFLVEWLGREVGMAELCRRYGISRVTGYKWVGRFEKEGWTGLQDQSRAPQHPWNGVAEEVEELIVKGRRDHPTWGPRKLLPWLRCQYGRQDDWPVASTVGEILKRHGLVRARKRRRRATPSAKPLRTGGQPNAVWCADFKGWFRTGDGKRCDPLTISDAYSRYLLRCQGMSNTKGERVQGLFEAVFREYGLPEVIRTDNGAPFASTGLGGLSRLSVWWIKLGIKPERIAPGKPYQNGSHERMHRTLKMEAINPPARTLRGQQRCFDRFREEYNQQRPHEALGQVPPARYYESSGRTYRGRVPAVEYPEGFRIRKVKFHGDLQWRGRRVYLTQALAGQPVGLMQIDDRHWEIYFSEVLLGILDSHRMEISQPRETAGGEE